jgi:hypothetical protein
MRPTPFPSTPSCADSVYACEHAHLNEGAAMMNRLATRMTLLALLAALGLAACAPEVGSERWCAKMKEAPARDWSLAEAGDFARHCVLPATTIGSKEWCEALEDVPKGDWTAKEAGDYAQHCIIRSNQDRDRSSDRDQGGD